MFLTVKEAARFLGVNESRIRSLIADGRLPVERKGRQVRILQTALEAFAEAEKSLTFGEPGTDPEPSMVPVSSLSGALERISARLDTLEARLAEERQAAAEEQRLHELLHEQDRQLAAKDLELEKLRRDLIYQQRLAEKELEDHRQACQERITRLEREAAARTAQERERTEQVLAQERRNWSERLARQEQTWSEKLAREQERFAQTLAARRDQEGLWARLVRMITWS